MNIEHPGQVKAGESSRFNTLVGNLYCPACEQLIRETRADPRADGKALPYCCEIYWIPKWQKYWSSDEGSYILQVHLSHATEIEPHWQIDSNEIEPDADDRTSPEVSDIPAATENTASIGNRAQTPRPPAPRSELNRGDPPLSAEITQPPAASPPRRETDTETQVCEERLPDAETTAYALVGDFIDLHVEFTTAEVRTYVVARRPSGKISKQGLTDALNEHISEGTLMRLEKGRYRRLR